MELLVRRRQSACGDWQWTAGALVGCALAAWVRMKATPPPMLVGTTYLWPHISHIHATCTRRSSTKKQVKAPPTAPAPSSASVASRVDITAASTGPAAAATQTTEAAAASGPTVLQPLSQPKQTQDDVLRRSDERVRRLTTLVETRRLYRNLIRAQHLLGLATPIYVAPPPPPEVDTDAEAAQASTSAAAATGLSSAAGLSGGEESGEGSGERAGTASTRGPSAEEDKALKGALENAAEMALVAEQLKVRAGWGLQQGGGGVQGGRRRAAAHVQDGMETAVWGPGSHGCAISDGMPHDSVAGLSWTAYRAQRPSKKPGSVKVVPPSHAGRVALAAGGLWQRDLLRRLGVLERGARAGIGPPGGRGPAGPPGSGAAAHPRERVRREGGSLNNSMCINTSAWRTGCSKWLPAGNVAKGNLLPQ